MKVVVGPDQPIVTGCVHPHRDGVGLPRASLGLAGCDEPDAFWDIRPVRNRVVVIVVDHQEFVDVA
jgi:hypothetical protein